MGAPVSQVTPQETLSRLEGRLERNADQIGAFTVPDPPIIEVVRRDLNSRKTRRGQRRSGFQILRHHEDGNRSTSLSLLLDAKCVGLKAEKAEEEGGGPDQVGAMIGRFHDQGLGPSGRLLPKFEG